MGQNWVTRGFVKLVKILMLPIISKHHVTQLLLSVDSQRLVMDNFVPKVAWCRKSVPMTGKYAIMGNAIVTVI